MILHVSFPKRFVVALARKTGSTLFKNELAGQVIVFSGFASAAVLRGISLLFVFGDF